MKTKVIAVVMTLLFLASTLSILFVPSATAHTEAAPFETELIAGQNIDVGDVLVWNDAVNLYVKYVTDVPWVLTETHLSVQTSLATIPQSNGNPVPGQFQYAASHNLATEYTYTIPLTWAQGKQLYIAAHAKVCALKSLTLESHAGVPVYGPASSYLPLNDAGWGTSALSVATWKHPAWPMISGSTAEWISTDYYITDDGGSARYDSWRKFSLSFNVPGIPIGGSIVTANSDNAEEVYSNGAMIGSDGTVNVPFDAAGGDPHEWSTIKDYAFNPVSGANKLDFIVHNYAYPTDDPTVNPTGLIYKAEVCYLTCCNTAWGAGKAFPGKNWATYFTYTVELVLPLYNWYDGTYHSMTPEYYVGTVGFAATSGKLEIDATLILGGSSRTYDVLLWHDYGLAGQGYWTIGTLTTDASGRGSVSITYDLTPGDYFLGLDLYWHSGGWQEILSAGNGVYGLQIPFTIPT